MSTHEDSGASTRVGVSLTLHIYHHMDSSRGGVNPAVRHRGGVFFCKSLEKTLALPWGLLL